MKLFLRLAIALALGLLGSAFLLAAGTGEKAAPRYRHAYYLFLAEGAEAVQLGASVPLILTKLPLEALSSGENDCLVITTYERDSVFWIRKDVLSADCVKPLERHLRIRPFLSQESCWYRYQEVGRSEVERLFKHPNGRIPVSRPGNYEDELRDLLSRLDLKDR